MNAKILTSPVIESKTVKKGREKNSRACIGIRVKRAIIPL